MTRGIRATTCDHIRTVWSVFTNSVGESFGPIERVVECCAKISRLVSAQNVSVTKELNAHLVTIAFGVAIARPFCVRHGMISVSTGEFLDQPLCGLLYPPPSNAEIQTTLHPVLCAACVIKCCGSAGPTVFLNNTNGRSILCYLVTVVFVVFC